MVSTKIIGFYIFFLIIFTTFTGLFSISKDSSNFDYKNYLLISKYRDKLSQQEGVLSKVVNTLLLPFILLDALIFLLAFLGISFTFLPPLVNILVFTPLGLIVFFDYVLPYVRGN